jgi:hypothetical protein
MRYAARCTRACALALMRQDFRKANRAWNNRPLVAASEMPSLSDVSFKEQSCK